MPNNAEKGEPILLTADPVVVDVVARALFADEGATYVAGTHVPSEEERELAAMLIASLRLRGYDITAVPSATSCNWYWGTHGCTLGSGHDLPHVCSSDETEGRCSEHDGKRARYTTDDGSWTEWVYSRGFTA